MSTGSTSTPEPQSVIELQAVAEMLETSFGRDLYLLRLSMTEYNRFAVAAAAHRGSAIVREWYVDHLLAGCRRLVDDGPDVISMRRALHRLRAVADKATALEIAEVRRRRGIAADACDPAGIDEYLSRIVPGHVVGGPIRRRAVQPDLDRIRDVANRARVVATHRVAHRLDAPSPPGVTFGELHTLLTDLFQIYDRWSSVLSAASIADMGDEGLLTSVARALELFDWRAYVEAVSEEWHRGGPAATESWDAVAARARIEYRFHPPAAEA